MKTQTKHSLTHLFLLGLLAMVLLAACGMAVPAASAAPTEADAVAMIAEAPDAVATAVPTAPIVAAPVGNGAGPGQARGSGAGPGQGQGTPVAPTGELSAAEAEALQFMREEEKMARDVYLALYAIWGVPVFDNIAASEQAHMDAVGYLLDSFGITDPAAGQAQGVFTNPDLQALHDQFVSQGSASLAAALLAAGAIEETDILDLQARLAQSENTAVIQVFENLLAGSENHLRAFAGNYERQAGEAYQPQLLSQEAYLAIINATSGRGMGPGRSNPGSGQPGTASRAAAWVTPTTAAARAAAPVTRAAPAKGAAAPAAATRTSAAGAPRATHPPQTTPPVTM